MPVYRGASVGDSGTASQLPDAKTYLEKPYYARQHSRTSAERELAAYSVQDYGPSRPSPHAPYETAPLTEAALPALRDPPVSSGRHSHRSCTPTTSSRSRGDGHSNAPPEGAAPSSAAMHRHHSKSGGPGGAAAAAGHRERTEEDHQLRRIGNAMLEEALQWQLQKRGEWCTVEHQQTHSSELGRHGPVTYLADRCRLPAGVTLAHGWPLTCIDATKRASPPPSYTSRRCGPDYSHPGDLDFFRVTTTVSASVDTLAALLSEPQNQFFSDATLTSQRVVATGDNDRAAVVQYRYANPTEPPATAPTTTAPPSAGGVAAAVVKEGTAKELVVLQYLRVFDYENGVRTRSRSTGVPTPPPAPLMTPQQPPRPDGVAASTESIAALAFEAMRRSGGGDTDVNRGRSARSTSPTAGTSSERSVQRALVFVATSVDDPRVPQEPGWTRVRVPFCVVLAFEGGDDHGNTTSPLATASSHAQSPVEGVASARCGPSTRRTQLIYMIAHEPPSATASRSNSHVFSLRPDVLIARVQRLQRLAAMMAHLVRTKKVVVRSRAHRFVAVSMIDAGGAQDTTALPREQERTHSPYYHNGVGAGGGGGDGGSVPVLLPSAAVYYARVWRSLRDQRWAAQPAAHPASPSPQRPTELHHPHLFQAALPRQTILAMDEAPGTASVSALRAHTVPRVVESIQYDVTPAHIDPEPTASAAVTAPTWADIDAFSEIPIAEEEHDRSLQPPQLSIVRSAIAPQHTEELNGYASPRPPQTVPPRVAQSALAKTDPAFLVDASTGEYVALPPGTAPRRVEERGPHEVEDAHQQPTVVWTRRQVYTVSGPDVDGHGPATVPVTAQPRARTLSAQRIAPAPQQLATLRVCFEAYTGLPEAPFSLDVQREQGGAPVQLYCFVRTTYGTQWKSHAFPYAAAGSLEGLQLNCPVRVSAGGETVTFTVAARCGAQQKRLGLAMVYAGNLPTNEAKALSVPLVGKAATTDAKVRGVLRVRLTAEGFGTSSDSLLSLSEEQLLRRSIYAALLRNRPEDLHRLEVYVGRYRARTLRDMNRLLTRLETASGDDLSLSSSVAGASGSPGDSGAGAPAPSRRRRSSVRAAEAAEAAANAQAEAEARAVVERAAFERAAAERAAAVRAEAEREARKRAEAERAAVRGADRAVFELAMAHDVATVEGQPPLRQSEAEAVTAGAVQEAKKRGQRRRPQARSASAQVVSQHQELPGAEGLRNNAVLATEAAGAPPRYVAPAVLEEAPLTLSLRSRSAPSLPGGPYVVLHVSEIRGLTAESGLPLLGSTPCYVQATLCHRANMVETASRVRTACVLYHHGAACFSSSTPLRVDDVDLQEDFLRVQVCTGHPLRGEVYAQCDLSLRYIAHHHGPQEARPYLLVRDAESPLAQPCGEVVLELHARGVDDGDAGRRLVEARSVQTARVAAVSRVTTHAWVNRRNELHQVDLMLDEVCTLGGIQAFLSKEESEGADEVPFAGLGLRKLQWFATAAETDSPCVVDQGKLGRLIGGNVQPLHEELDRDGSPGEVALPRLYVAVAAGVHRYQTRRQHVVDTAPSNVPQSVLWAEDTITFRGLLPNQEELTLAVFEENEGIDLEVGRIVVPLRAFPAGQEHRVCVPLVALAGRRGAYHRGAIEVEVLAKGEKFSPKPWKGLRPKWEQRERLTRMLYTSAPELLHLQLPLLAARTSGGGETGVLQGAEASMEEVQRTPYFTVELLGLRDLRLRGSCYVKAYMDERTVLRTATVQCKSSAVSFPPKSGKVRSTISIDDPRHSFLRFKVGRHRFLGTTEVLAYAELSTDIPTKGSFTSWLPLYDPVGASYVGELGVALSSADVATFPYSTKNAVPSVTAEMRIGVQRDVVSLMRHYAPQELCRLQPSLAQFPALAVAHRVLRGVLVPQPIACTFYIRVHGLQLLAGSDLQPSDFSAPSVSELGVFAVYGAGSTSDEGCYGSCMCKLITSLPSPAYVSGGGNNVSSSQIKEESPSVIRMDVPVPGTVAAGPSLSASASLVMVTEDGATAALTASKSGRPPLRPTRPSSVATGDDAGPALELVVQHCPIRPVSNSGAGSRVAVRNGSFSATPSGPLRSRSAGAASAAVGTTTTPLANGEGRSGRSWSVVAGARPRDSSTGRTPAPTRSRSATWAGAAPPLSSRSNSVGTGRHRTPSPAALVGDGTRSHPVPMPPVELGRARVSLRALLTPELFGMGEMVTVPIVASTRAVANRLPLASREAFCRGRPELFVLGHLQVSLELPYGETPPPWMQLSTITGSIAAHIPSGTPVSSLSRGDVVRLASQLQDRYQQSVKELPALMNWHYDAYEYHRPAPLPPIPMLRSPAAEIIAVLDPSKKRDAPPNDRHQLDWSMTSPKEAGAATTAAAKPPTQRVASREKKTSGATARAPAAAAVGPTARHTSASNGRRRAANGQRDAGAATADVAATRTWPAAPSPASASGSHSGAAARAGASGGGGSLSHGESGEAGGGSSYVIHTRSTRRVLF